MCPEEAAPERKVCFSPDLFRLRLCLSGSGSLLSFILKVYIIELNIEYHLTEVANKLLTFRTLRLKTVLILGVYESTILKRRPGL